MAIHVQCTLFLYRYAHCTIIAHRVDQVMQRPLLSSSLHRMHRVMTAAFDWWKPVGRPRITWLRTIDKDLQSLNFGVRHTAWRKARDRDVWHQVVSIWQRSSEEFATKGRMYYNHHHHHYSACTMSVRSSACYQ